MVVSHATRGAGNLAQDEENRTRFGVILIVAIIVMNAVNLLCVAVVVYVVNRLLSSQPGAPPDSLDDMLARLGLSASTVATRRSQRSASLRDKSTMTESCDAGDAASGDAAEELLGNRATLRRQQGRVGLPEATSTGWRSVGVEDVEESATDEGVRDATAKCRPEERPWQADDRKDETSPAGLGVSCRNDETTRKELALDDPPATQTDFVVESVEPGLDKLSLPVSSYRSYCFFSNDDVGMNEESDTGALDLRSSPCDGELGDISKNSERFVEDGPEEAFQRVIQAYDALNTCTEELSFIGGCILGNDKIQVLVRDDYDIEQCRRDIMNVTPPGTEHVIIVCRLSELT